MADSTHYNYHYSCCGATQRLCVRYHTNNTISTINLFAELGRGLRDQADFRQEEEQRPGKRWEIKLQQTATNTLSSLGLLGDYQHYEVTPGQLVNRKAKTFRENNLTQVIVPGSKGEGTPTVTNIAARHPSWNGIHPSPSLLCTFTFQ